MDFYFILFWGFRGMFDGVSIGQMLELKWGNVGFGLGVECGGFVRFNASDPALFFLSRSFLRGWRGKHKSGTTCIIGIRVRILNLNGWPYVRGA